MKVTADRAACTGSGNCVRLAPEWFDQDEDEGLVILTSDSPPAEFIELMRDVVDMCPTRALELEVD
mgnify:FL=1|jgi:ferredoxin